MSVIVDHNITLYLNDYITLYLNVMYDCSSLQDKKSSTVSNPVACVKPTTLILMLPLLILALVTTRKTLYQPVLNLEPLSRMPSFPTQEPIPEEPVIVTSKDDHQVKVSSAPTVPSPAPTFVPPVVGKSSSFATNVTTAVSESNGSSFTPFTFVVSHLPLV